MIEYFKRNVDNLSFDEAIMITCFMWLFLYHGLIISLQNEEEVALKATNKKADELYIRSLGFKSPRILLSSACSLFSSL